ncbi:hypothetical protein KM043_008730 [Ampulex compressa]|nr:hypothetical protein KM043_008730 [Ampulex compressa]
MSAGTTAWRRIALHKFHERGTPSGAAGTIVFSSSKGGWSERTRPSRARAAVVPPPGSRARDSSGAGFEEETPAKSRNDIPRLILGQEYIDSRAREYRRKIERRYRVLKQRQGIRMALTIALPLSGLEPEHFCALGTRLLYEQGLRTLSGCGPISPSTGSESSGVGSLVPSVESSTPEPTPTFSRPDTPAEETSKRREKGNVSLRVFYKDRDILNLGANIREPFWQMRSPSMPRYDFRSFMANRSVYYRLGEYGLTEEYPIVSRIFYSSTIVLTVRLSDK